MSTIYPIMNVGTLNINKEKLAVQNANIQAPHTNEAALPFDNNANRYLINFTSKYQDDNEKTFDLEALQRLGITNFRATNEDGVRGESLSARANKVFLAHIKEAGIERVIDLRTADHSDKFPEACKAHGLEYSHFPIDSAVTPDEEIIKFLPELIDTINQGKFYISCAQGMHRTDIALSLYYLFNPDDSKKPPILYGHLKDGHLRYDDIFRRVNSIKNKLTPEDMENLHLDSNFEETFKNRKKELINYNQRFL